MVRASGSRHFLVVFALYCVTTFVQSYRLFLWPPLYCEDGLFFTHFYNDRTSSPFGWFYNGYVAIGPNLLGYAATFLPPRVAPYLFSGVALLTGGVAYAVFTLARFRTVVASDTARVIIASLLVLWPLGDFAVAHSGVYALWHLLMLLVLLALAPAGPANARGFAWLGVQLIAVWSHPMCVVLIPVWAASALLWDRTRFGRGCRLVLIAAAALFYSLAVRHRPYDPLSANVLDKTLYLLSVRVFLESMIGPALVVKIYQSEARWLAVVLGATLFFLPTALAVVKRKRLGPAVRRFLWISLYAVVVMMWVSATTRPLPHRPDLWAGRYYYLPQYFFLLAAAVIVEEGFSVASWPRRRLAAALVPVVAWCAGLLYVDRYAFWEEVPTEGPQVARFLARVAEAEKGERPEEKLLFRRGKWSLEFRVRRAE